MRLSRFPGVETLPNCLFWRCGCFLGWEPHLSPVDPCTEWVRMPRTDTPVFCLPCFMGGAPEEGGLSFMGPQGHLASSLSLGSLNPLLGSLEGLPWEPGDLMPPKSEGGRCQRRPSCFRTGFLDPHHPWGVLRTDTLPCDQPGLALCPGDWCPVPGSRHREGLEGPMAQPVHVPTPPCKPPAESVSAWRGLLVGAGGFRVHDRAEAEQ